MFPNGRIVAGVAMAAALWLWASAWCFGQSARAASGERWRCGEGVSVVAPTEAAAGSVCAQAAKARDFLDGCGISSHHDISVHITPTLSRFGLLHRAGDYDPALRRARLLPLASYLRIAKPRLGSTPIAAHVLHASVAA